MDLDNSIIYGLETQVKNFKLIRKIKMKKISIATTTFNT